MQLKIDGKPQTLNFGVGFVREMDQTLGMLMSAEGTPSKINFGMGVNKAIPGLKSFDVAVLSDVIYCSCHNSKNRPGHEKIDAYIDGITNIDELKKLFNDVQDELAKSNATKLVLNSNDNTEKN